MIRDVKNDFRNEFQWAMCVGGHQPRAISIDVNSATSGASTSISYVIYWHIQGFVGDMDYELGNQKWLLQDWIGYQPKWKNDIAKGHDTMGHRFELLCMKVLLVYSSKSHFTIHLHIFGIHDYLIVLKGLIKCIRMH